MSRFTIRSSETKAQPDPSDLLLKELGYSFVTETLYIKYPNGEVKPIAGNSVFQQLQNINKMPVTNPDTATLIDANRIITGNVLTNDSDPEGDFISVNEIVYSGGNRSVGTTFNTVYGTFRLNSDGAWIFTIGSAGSALTQGQVASEEIYYRVLDARSTGSKLEKLTINITGTNQGPVGMTDSVALPPNVTSTGNVLTNDFDYEGSPLTVVSLTVSGHATTYQPGDVIDFGAAGLFSLDSNGAWSVSPTNGYYGLIPMVTYRISDGVSESNANLIMSILPPVPTRQDTITWFKKYRNGEFTPGQIAPNPFNLRDQPVFNAVDITDINWKYYHVLPNRIGVDLTSYDFRVGPGMEYAELSEVPWLNLRPGDRVFVYWRAQPYRHVLPVHVRGEITRWIEIIGVRGPQGQLPELNGIGAENDPVNSRLNDTHTGAGLINIIQPLGIGASTSYRPGYIHIHGLKITAAYKDNEFINMYGQQTRWGHFSAGIKVMGGDYITISGCEIHDNSCGIFANSNPNNGPRFQLKNLHILFNYIYDNGEVGDTGTHNSYSESTNTIYEFNYIGANKNGNAGDSIKDRSTGQIFRYNHIRSGPQNCISLREPQATYVDALTITDVFGIKLANFPYIYGNTFFMDNVANVIGHGDGPFYSEHNQVTGGGIVFFYKNVVAIRADSSSGFFNNVYYDSFNSSLFSAWNTREPMKFYAKNNILYSGKRTPTGKLPKLGFFAYAGVLEASDTNFARNVVPTAYDPATANRDGISVLQGISYKGSLVDLNITNQDVDPGFVSYDDDDVSLLPTSVYYNLNAQYHPMITERGLTPQGDPINYPYMEMPPPKAISQAYVTGNRVIGNVLTANKARYSPKADSSTIQWMRKLNGISSLIVGQTNDTYTSTNDDIGYEVYFVETAVNDAGLTTAISAGIVIVSATTPQIVTLATISGSKQSGFPVRVTTGTWTNSPVSYTYQWYAGNTLLIGQNTYETTPTLDMVGAGLRCLITATNSIGESWSEYSETVYVKAATADPDAYRKFNFSASSGTAVRTLDSRWAGSLAFGSYPALDYFYCDGEGYLRGSYVSKNAGGYCWFVDAETGPMSQVEMRIKQPLQTTFNFEVGAVLRATMTQAYGFFFNSSNLRITRNWVEQTSIPYTLTADTILKVVPTANDTFEVYINGVLFTTYTDPTPLSGGHPGFTMNSGSDEMTRVDYWTYNPSGEYWL